MNRTFVVTRNRFQFTDWCRFNDYNPHSKELVSVCNPERVRGMMIVDGDKVVYTGEWWLNPHIEEIEQMLKIIDRRTKK